MKPLFTEDNLVVLESLAKRRALYAFDFDGTLAPIVQSHEEAQISKMTYGYLKQLNDLVPLAIISGRNEKDLESRLLFKPKYVIGSHGFDEESPGLGEALETCNQWSRFLENSLLIEKNLLGIEIENKGCSIAVHFRKAEDKGKSRLEILNSIANLETSSRVILGKAVINIIPSGVPNKGASFLKLMMHEQVESALYVGDDDTDEDVFSLNYNNIVTVRIGEKENSNAQFYLKVQNDVNKLLRHLLDYNRHLHKKNAHFL